MIQLNVCHLLCPLPVLRLQKYLRTLSSGDQIEITGTGQDTRHEIDIFQKDSKSFSIEISETLPQDHWRIIVQKI